jgi:hypothetical protein
MYTYIDVNDVANLNKSGIQRVDVDEVKNDSNEDDNEISNISQAHDKG